MKASDLIIQLANLIRHQGNVEVDALMAPDGWPDKCGDWEPRTVFGASCGMYEGEKIHIRVSNSLVERK